MDTNQINDALDRIFNEEKARIVFWNDPEREFLNTLPFVLLEGVNILRLDEIGALEAKIRIERDDPHGKFLLYSPTEEPDYEDDWLLDIRLYSRSFRADRASIILDELGLTTSSFARTSDQPPQVLRQQGAAPEAQGARRRRRQRRRPRPQDAGRGRQGRPAGTLQHRPHAVPRL